MRREDLGEGGKLSPVQEKALSGAQLSYAELQEYRQSLEYRLFSDKSTPDEAKPSLRAELDKVMAEIHAMEDIMAAHPEYSPEKVKEIIEAAKAQTSTVPMPWPFDAFFTALGKALEPLGRVLQPVWQGFVQILSTIAEWLRRNVLDPILAMVQRLMSELADIMASAMGVILRSVTSIIHPSSAVAPEDALKAFGLVSASVLGISALISTVNAAHPLKDLIGAQQVAFIYKFLGFSELTTAFWGSVGTEILDYPMRLWARMTYRARVPGHAEADEMLWHGQISRDEWYRMHTYEGWKDEYIQAHYASQWRNPSIREIGMITDAVALEPTKIEEMLRELGYDPEDLPLLAAVLARRPIADELRTLRADLIREAVDGYMSIEELESALRAIGARDSELALIRQIVAIRRARAQRKQVLDAAKDWTAKRVTALTEAYRRDLLSEDEYLEELLDAGVEASVAAQTLYLEEVRKLPKPRRA